MSKVAAKVEQSEVETEAESPQSDAELLHGSPFEGEETLSEATEGEVPATETPAVTTPKAPIYKGLKGEFHTQDELAEYTRQMETKVLEYEARQSGFDAAIQASGKKADEVPVEEPALDPNRIAEEFFSNPTGAIEKLRADIKREILGEVRRESTNQTFWESFYEKNPELRGAEDIVDLTLNKHRAEWSNVPVSKAKDLLAEQVKLRLSALRGGSSGGGKVLGDSQAQTLSASPARAPAPPSAQVSRKPTTLIGSLRDLQAKRQKRIAG